MAITKERKGFIRKGKFPASGYELHIAYTGEPGSQNISAIEGFTTRRMAERCIKQNGLELVKLRRACQTAAL